MHIKSIAACYSMVLQHTPTNSSAAALVRNMHFKSYPIEACCSMASGTYYDL